MHGARHEGDKAPGNGEFRSPVSVDIGTECGMQARMEDEGVGSGSAEVGEDTEGSAIMEPSRVTDKAGELRGDVGKVRTGDVGKP